MVSGDCARRCCRVVENACQWSIVSLWTAHVTQAFHVSGPLRRSFHTHICNFRVQNDTLISLKVTLILIQANFFFAIQKKSREQRHVLVM